jgi:hypothetical protein
MRKGLGRRKERNRKDMKNAKILERGIEEERMGGKEIKERNQMEMAEARK